MFSKLVILCTVVAAAAAITPGYLDGALALGGQSEHTVRGFGGLSSVSKQAKAIHSPYSSSSKTDIRVTNDGFAPAYHGLAHHAYAAPAYAHHGHAAYAAPAYHAGLAHHAPLAHHAHAYAAPAYAAPIAHHAHATYAAPAYAHPIAHAGLAHPYAAHGHLPVKSTTGLGVSYSPAIGVAHSHFSGYGIHYGY